MPTPPRPPKPPIKVAPVQPTPAPDLKHRKFRLTEDIQSNFYDKGKKIVYGRKGDVVTEISGYGEILAVEAADGSRYSVRLTKLMEISSSSNQFNQ